MVDEVALVVVDVGGDLGGGQGLVVVRRSLVVVKVLDPINSATMTKLTSFKLFELIGWCSQTFPVNSHYTTEP